MSKKSKVITSYGLVCLLVLLYCCIVYIIKGIWPFGSLTIDYHDMGQELAAQYIQIYDELHLSKSFLYDWYLSLGRGIAGGTIVSLLNIFLYFIPRDMLLESFSIMLILKMMLMAAAMHFYLRKCFKSCPAFYSIVLSVGYGTCGFVLMNYTIIRWLDITILVPLILLFTTKVLREGKIWGYAICICLAMLVTFYIPVMILIFVFLMSGLYLSCEKIWDKDECKHIYIGRLGIGTLLGLMLSAWSWIPEITKASSSMRFGNESESGLLSLYLKILSHVNHDYATIWWALLGASFAMAITGYGLISDFRAKQFKRLVFTLGAVIIVCAELLFENIQVMWYFGSYVNYPARNGFLIYIVLASSAAFYSSVHLKGDTEPLDDKKKTNIIYYVCWTAACLFLLLSGIHWYMTGTNRNVYDVFRVSALVMIAATIIHSIFIVFKSGRFAKMSAILLATELIFYGVLLIGKPNYTTVYSDQPEQESEYIRIVNELDTKMDISKSRLERIKNPDTSLNTNYGIFLQRATLAGWMPYANSQLMAGSSRMGYSTQYTRTLDSGGNIFTDTLLHVTSVLSCIPQDENIYKLSQESSATVNHVTGEERMYYLYDSEYVLPFGTIISDYNSINTINKAELMPDYINALFNAIVPIDSKEYVYEDDNVLCQEIKGISDKVIQETVSFAISGNKALYLYSYEPGADSEYENAEIIVNGKTIPVPTIHNIDNTRFTAHFNNRTLFLGSFRDESVNVKINIDESLESPEYKVCIYSIDLDMLKRLCESYETEYSDMSFTAKNRSFEAKLNGLKGQYVLLPIAYDSGWTVKVNGEKQPCLEINGIIMAVPLCEGENVINMTYFPRNMKLGIIISFLGLLIIPMFVLVKEYIDSMDYVLCKIYILSFAVVILFMYIIPAVYSICYQVSARL